jgi:LPS export ABC transporter permease LptF
VNLLDRYLLREALPPCLLAFGLFTFLLAVNPVLENARAFLAAGVDLPTVGFLLLTLLPQAMGVTIPMALLAGLLMALGRLSGDRETVAMLACGISPLRMLRSVLLLATLTGLANLYVLTKLVPDSNQRFREETFKLLAQKSESDIKPGLFYEGFPGKMLWVREANPAGGWSGVFLADTTQPGRPAVTMADSGYLSLDPDKRQVAIVLPGESFRYIPGQEDGTYDLARATDVRFAISADSVFGDGATVLTRGGPEMTIADLRHVEERKIAEGISPHPEVIRRHQMFSFPVACLVFAILAVALGMHTRRDGKMGGFTLGVAVIFGYYGVMTLFESFTKGGQFPAHWARWVPNIVFGAIGIAALRWRSRAIGSEWAITLPSVLTARRKKANPVGLPAQPRVVLVIRVPDVRLPRPRLLDLYVIRRYASVAAVAFLGLLALYYIGTFIDKSERLFKRQADIWMLAEFFVYSTPQFVTYVAPMAVLVSVLATIGGLTRTSELTVMRACGVSLYRTAVPLVVISLVWGVLLFMLDDRVLARANRQAEVVENQIRGLPPRVTTSVVNKNWMADPKGRIYYYAALDTDRRTLVELSVFEMSARPFRLSQHIRVDRATFANGRWQGHEGWVQQFRGTDRAVRAQFADRTLPLEPIESFSRLNNRETDLMTFIE